MGLSIQQYRAAISGFIGPFSSSIKKGRPPSHQFSTGKVKNSSLITMLIATSLGVGLNALLNEPVPVGETNNAIQKLKLLLVVVTYLVGDSSVPSTGPGSNQVIIDCFR